MAVHGEGRVPLAQVTVNAIGVSDGDGGDDGARTGFAPSTVAYGVSFPEMEATGASWTPGRALMP